MYYSHTKYSQSRKSLPLHWLLLIWKKKISQSILFWNASRGTSEKLSKKTQEGSPADLEKKIIILYFSHTQKKGWSRKLSSEMCPVVKRSVFPSNWNRNVRLKFLVKVFNLIGISLCFVSVNCKEKIFFKLV